MPNTLGTAIHWRRRPQEAREQAEAIKDSEAREARLAVAKSYEKIAKRVEASAKQSG
jgi:hypothetical protein